MTRLAFGSAGEAGPEHAAEELGAFLERLLRWDRAAVVRLRSAPGEAALGVFGQPPFGGVLAVKGVGLAGGGADAAVDAAVDATVSAGQLLDAVVTVGGGGEFTLPGSVTGPAWTGVLPPRGGWRRVAEIPGESARAVAAEVVAEFRARTAALPARRRTRRELDALAAELWARPFGGPVPGVGLEPASGVGPGPDRVPLRVVHAAYALGFLRVPPGGDGQRARPAAVDAADAVAILWAGGWVRLRTGYGSVAARLRPAAFGLTVSPVVSSSALPGESVSTHPRAFPASST